MCTLPNLWVQAPHRDEFINSASCPEFSESASTPMSGRVPRSRPRPRGAERRSGACRRPVPEPAHGLPPTQEGVLRDDLEHQVGVVRRAAHPDYGECGPAGVSDVTPHRVTPSRTHPGSDARRCRKCSVCVTAIRWKRLIALASAVVRGRPPGDHPQDVREVVPHQPPGQAAPTMNTVRKSSVGADAQRVECPGLPVPVHWCSSVTGGRGCLRSKLR